MKYYKQTENRTVQMLMEVLEEEARKNPVWTLQELFALCRNLSFLDDVPENADYFDEIYLIFAELFSEFHQYHQMIDGPEGLRNVRDFSTDETAKNELLSVLDALYSGTIQGRTRSLTAKWEKEGVWQEWQRHIEELRSDIAEVLPMQTHVDPEDIGESAENRSLKKKKDKRNRGMTFILMGFSFLFIWFVLYLFVQGAGNVYHEVSLRRQGVKATAEVTQIVCSVFPSQTDSIKEQVRDTYYEVVRFQTKNGNEVESHLYAKGESEDRYSVGDKVEIYYHPDAPAQIIDAHSNSQLMKGITAVGVGLLVFLVLSALSRGLFSSMGAFGLVFSIGSKVILLLAAIGVLAYQNINTIYRYFPAAHEDECMNQNGVLVRKENGKPFTGRLHSYSEHSLSVYAYKDGLLDGLDVIYYDGIVKETGHWKEGKQNGLFTLYTTGGVLIDHANFEDGERHGLTRQYDSETGSVLYEGNYKHGEQDGLWIQYNPDTGYIIMEQTYRDGILHGPAKQYYPDGQLQIDMNYEGGIPQGSYKAYYPNGQLQVEDSLENGSYSSRVKMYTEDGVLLSDVFPDEG